MPREDDLYEYGPARYERMKAAEEERKRRRKSRQKKTTDDDEERDPYDEAERLINDEDTDDDFDSEN